MKKVLALLVTLLLLSGCALNKQELNKQEIDEIFKKYLVNNTKLINNSSKGYKYYLPYGVKIVESDNYNEKLYTNGYYYYLYVDVVSYYYKSDINYDINESLFYSNNIDSNNKNGYAEIEKIDDLYRIKVYYNYSSIETYVNYVDIRITLVNISYILNSVEFNDSITKLIVGNEKSKLGMETFDFYTPRKEGNFIDYINKYDEYEEEQPENNLGNEEESE